MVRQGVPEGARILPEPLTPRKLEPALCCATLPQALIQAHTRRHCQVQAVDCATHWQTDKLVAALSRQAPQAPSFAPDNKRSGPAGIEIEQALFGSGIRTDNPNALFP